MRTPANRKRLTKACFAELQKCDGNLKGFERVKAIWVESYVNELGNAFGTENKLLTPSMKMIRTELKTYYNVHLKEMYVKLGMPLVEGENWL